jgi:hypothetical protein
LVLLAAVLVLGSPSCSPAESGQEDPAGSSAASGTTNQPPIVISPESAALSDELKRTAQATAVLTGQLQQDQAPADDPRVPLVYGLRARAQAITARKALLEGQPDVADAAATQLGVLLRRADGASDEQVALAVAAAAAGFESLGIPSQGERESVNAVLDRMMGDLEPLFDAAAAAAPPG